MVKSRIYYFLVFRNSFMKPSGFFSFWIGIMLILVIPNVNEMVLFKEILIICDRLFFSVYQTAE